jgi:hypothetical protein
MENKNITSDPEQDFIDQAKQFAMTDAGLTEDEAERAVEEFLENNNI